jgi:phospholipase B1
MIKHYNPHATGGSRGYNVFLDVCFGEHRSRFAQTFLTLLAGKLCPAGSWGWNDAVDQLNAAQSGSLASNLPHQVHDYLIPQVRKWNIPAEKFKYINIQIGSNDLCWLCAQATWGRGRGSADDFEANIRTTLEALRAAIRGHFL